MKTVRALLSFVSCQLSVVIFFAFLLSLITGSAYAAPGLPDPKPCQFPETTDKLTDNYVVNEDGEPPLVQTVTKTGKLGDTATIQVQESFTVDFSKLQSIFGVPNSDYLEGKFQNEEHRTSNLLDLKSAAFNLFHGSGQKAAPKPIVDDLKVKYVEYVYNKPTLPEAANEYTDIKGEGDPITIFQMITKEKFPYPPQPPKPSEDRTQWLETWGKYWEKIPTAYSEFYVGYLEFRVAAGKKLFQQIKDGEACPDHLRRPPIFFVMPEFFRTTSISDQLNRIVVPCAAQSWRHGVNDDECGEEDINKLNDRYKTAQSENLLSKAINLCKNLINGPPKVLLKKLQKVVQTSFKFVQPVKNALAADPAPASPSPSPSCVKVLTPGKEGIAPYCGLPTLNLPFQLMGDDSCTNKVSENKLDEGNLNVICTFVVSWDIPPVITYPYDPGWDQCTPNADGTYSCPTIIDPNNPLWDSCDPPDADGRIKCTTKVRIWPVFRIPFLSEIWNNTMYSNEAEGEPNAGGVGSRQETGRPGIYSSFTPKAIYSKLFPNKYEQAQAVVKDCFDNKDIQACKELSKALSECLGKAFEGPIDPAEVEEALRECLANTLGKNLPGQVADNSNVAGAKTNVLGATSDDAKERFIGATDCNKFFTRDIALKPKALQEAIGIDKQECNLEAAAIPETGGDGDGGIPPGTDCTSISDGDPTNGIETSRDELICYIAEKAADKTEPITGLNLAEVMFRVMDAESSGNQCTSGLAGEIGVFQYIAITWKETGAPNGIDSGSTTPSLSGACWGNRGSDPVATVIPPGSDPTWFDWVFRFGLNEDGEAWNPYLQIDKTVIKMETEGGCAWSTFKEFYPGLCT